MTVAWCIDMDGSAKRRKRGRIDSGHVARRGGGGEEGAQAGTLSEQRWAKEQQEEEEAKKGKDIENEGLDGSHT